MKKKVLLAKIDELEQRIIMLEDALEQHQIREMQRPLYYPTPVTPTIQPPYRWTDEPHEIKITCEAK